MFVLGHALYMRAIHGGKATNDRIDAHKIAALLRGGMMPQAYVYPQAMRATRDLMRRRNYLMRQRAELLSHITNTNHQYNLSALGVRPARPAERAGLLYPLTRRGLIGVMRQCDAATGSNLKTRARFEAVEISPRRKASRTSSSLQASSTARYGDHAVSSSRISTSTSATYLPSWTYLILLRVFIFVSR